MTVSCECSDLDSSTFLAACLKSASADDRRAGRDKQPHRQQFVQKSRAPSKNKPNGVAWHVPDKEPFPVPLASLLVRQIGACVDVLLSAGA